MYFPLPVKIKQGNSYSTNFLETFMFETFNVMTRMHFRNILPCFFLITETNSFLYEVRAEIKDVIDDLKIKIYLMFCKFPRLRHYYKKIQYFDLYKDWIENSAQI